MPEVGSLGLTDLWARARGRLCQACGGRVARIMLIL